jgi:hypothetical protein
MGKGKLTIHPPGTPLEPDHPFATPQILFVPRCSPPSSTPNAASTHQPSQAAESGPDSDAATIKSWAELITKIEEDLRAEGRTVNVSEACNTGEFIVTFPQRPALEAVQLPLVPQLPPDLEDIAFEILRSRYKGR